MRSPRLTQFLAPRLPGVRVMRSAPLRKAIVGLDEAEAERLAFRSNCSGSLRFLLELVTIVLLFFMAPYCWETCHSTRTVRHLSRDHTKQHPLSPFHGHMVRARFTPRNELCLSCRDRQELLATKCLLGISSALSIPLLSFPHSFSHTKPDNMRFTGIPSLLLLTAGAVQAASSWSFDDGSVSISNKKGGEADKNR